MATNKELEVAKDLCTDEMTGGKDESDSTNSKRVPTL